MDFLGIIHSIPGWLSDHEAWWLYEMARALDREGDIVEIGSWKGKSTVALSLGVRDGIQRKVIAVDPHKGELFAGQNAEGSTYSKFIANLKRNRVRSFVTPVKKTSVAAACDWHEKIAMLFIDGLHDYKHAKEDFLVWYKFVVPGGIIAFHDGFCGMPGVWQAIDELFLPSDITEIGTVGSIVYGLKGRPDKTKKILVSVKIALLRAAQKLHNQNPPKFLELVIIHKFVRLLLLNMYTLQEHII